MFASIQIAGRPYYLFARFFLASAKPIRSVYLFLPGKYPVNPLSALERLPFSGFQSSLIADRKGSAIRPATQNLAKGKPLLSRAGDISLNSLTEAPVVFPAFAVGETASPQAQRKANAEGGRTSPMSKASENKGLNGGSEKKCPLPVNGCWISNAFFCIPGIAY